jgi:hypothetical protein
VGGCFRPRDMCLGLVKEIQDFVVRLRDLVLVFTCVFSYLPVSCSCFVVVEKVYFGVSCRADSLRFVFK